MNDTTEKTKSTNVKMITLRVNEETLDNWDNFCESRGMPRSELIRAAVDNYLTYTSGETFENLVGGLLLEYTEKFSKSVVQNLSLKIEKLTREIEYMRQSIGKLNIIPWFGEEENVENPVKKEIDEKSIDIPKR
ncbi:MAG: CopG family transcriptional regulator [Promethearchaeota archaeon]|nr:MAG: CopG family transcriptional regulator [Candidatus Lokiarchaeota archaeon]